MPAAGALLGVGAHLVNVLPDLADDEATGVRGLPHRIGARRLPVVAAGVLAAGSLVVALGAGCHPDHLAGRARRGRGPGRRRAGRPRAGAVPLAAVGIALVNVVLLVASAPAEHASALLTHS